jgi:hypothetical protein
MTALCPSASFSYLSLFPHILIKIQRSKSKIIFYVCVEEGCSVPRPLALEKQS